MRPSSGSVSDRFILFWTSGIFVSADVSLLCEYFLVDICGDGSLLGGNNVDGMRERDIDGTMLVGFLVRLGRGKLLKVRLRGIPPMGSSGRQM